jgi:hypothetical protein
MIRLCDVTLCFDEAGHQTEEGHWFCPKHAQWYAEYVAAGQPRDVRRWLRDMATR